MAGKIDQELMMRMISEGKTIASIARHFGCRWQAIAEMKKRIEKRLALIPDAERSELARDNIDTVHQLRKMNDHILDELKRCRRLIDRQDELAKEREKLEDQVKHNPEDTDLVKKLNSIGLTNINDILKIQNNIIAISAEVRKQIELQVKIYETVYNIRLVGEFQEEILNILRSVDPALRDATIKRLKERRSMRGLVRLDR